MKYNLRDLSNQLNVLIFLLSMSISLGGCDRSAAKNQARAETQPLPYKILYDEMTAKMSIGVDSEINEEQLKATLRQAADDHQNDAARDYLVADNLWVDAYLVLQEKRSSVPAGRLGRYVPPRNPNAKDEDTATQKEDQFLFTLLEAKRSLQ